MIPVADPDRSKAFYETPRVAARRRLRVRQRLPRRAVHAARLGRLGPVRHEDHDGRARQRPGPVPDRLRHRGRARRARRLRRRRSARSSIPARRARSSPRTAPSASAGPPRSTRATARSRPSATPTATSGCCRRSPQRLPGRIDAAETRVRLGGRPGRRDAPRLGRPRRAREARRRRVRRELARLVRRLHGGRAGRHGAADMSDIETEGTP